MTPQDIIDEAQTFVPDTSDAFPVPEWVSFQRINARQRQLFALAASWDEEFFGRRIKVGLDAGYCVDLSRVESEKVAPIELIDRVEICGLGDPHPHGYELGDTVTVCAARERHRHVKPRAMIRSKLLEGVSERDGETLELVNDLEGVTQIRIWYSRGSRAIDGEGKVKLSAGPVERDVEIGDPWEWLLVWDLVKSLVGRTAKDDAEQKNPVWVLADNQEKMLIETFKTHVMGFADVTEHITD